VICEGKAAREVAALGVEQKEKGKTRANSPLLTGGRAEAFLAAAVHVGGREMLINRIDLNDSGEAKEGAHTRRNF
jgi:hypothetical protein